MERECNECGSTDWRKLLSTDYPERRSERDRTVMNVYDCKDCGSQGKHFNHKDSGTTQYTGALR